MKPSADNIATFVEVVRQRSLSGAARSLGLPKSTISRRLMRLERSLQSKLLERNARSVALTNAGREFYASVAFAVDALGDAVAQLEQSSLEPRGHVRLTAPPDLGRMLLSPMLGAFLQRQPEISLHVKYSNDVLDLVGEGLDLAVRATSLLRPDLIARRVCRSKLQLAASPAWLASIGPLHDVRSLEQQAFVLFGHAARMQQLHLDRDEAKGKHKKSLELEVTGRISVDDYAALAELVAQGQGPGLMPALHVQSGVAAGRLVRLFPEWSQDAGSVYLVYASRRQPERVRLLAEFLVAEFAKLDHV